MKKLILITGLCLIYNLVQAQELKTTNDSYPLKGKFEFRFTQYLQFREIEFWVFDATGKVHFYVNHATGTNKPLDKIMFSASEEYIALMTKNGYEASYKRNKRIPR